MMVSSDAASPTHACKCMVWAKEKDIKIFLKIGNRYFQVHIRNQLQIRPYSDKDFVNPPICLILILAFKSQFASLLSTEDS